MVFNCKKCTDILKVTSGGRAEEANLKLCHFSHFQFQLWHQKALLTFHCTFYIYVPLVKKTTFRFLKYALFTELSPRMSWSCPSNVLQDILGDNSIEHLLKIWMSFFLPMVHRCKKTLKFCCTSIVPNLISCTHMHEIYVRTCKLCMCMCEILCTNSYEISMPFITQKNKAKTLEITFLTGWPWPSNSFKILSRSIPVPNFTTVRQRVLPWER